MIYLDRMLCSKVLKEVSEAHDCVDIQSDLNEIDIALSQLCNGIGQQNARQLDCKLRTKYPINALLETASSMTLLSGGYSKSAECAEAVALKQDRCGIICHAALKKGMVQSIHQMIEGVD